ncbi:MAG: TolC family protein [Polyangiales bacterium]
MSIRSFFVLILLMSQTVRAQDVPATPPAEAVPQGEGTRVLTLESALATARTKSPLLRQATAQAQVGGARQDIARAALLPTLTGTASYQRTTANFIPRPGFAQSSTVAANGLPALTWESYNYFQFGVTASVLLYDFQGSIDRFRASKETRRGLDERAKATGLQVDFAVRDAFFRVRAQRGLIGVARETLANNQRHVEQIQAFVEVGTRPEIDLRQVRTDLANARVSLVQADNNYQIARATLKQAMGVDDASGFDVADEQLSKLPGEDAATDVLLQEAIASRPDVVALERDLRASALTASAARGTFGPTLSASTAINTAGLTVDEQRWNWNAGVQANWPIARGGASIAELKAARAEQRRVEASIAELRQTVRLQVEQARLGVGAALATLEAAGEARDNARARLGLAEGRYEAGVGNAIELGDAQVAFTSAEAQSVSAEYSLSVARAQLLSALGRSR